MHDRADARGSLVPSQGQDARNSGEMLTASPGLLIRTIEGRLTFWPAGMEQRYGFTSKQALGQISHKLLRTAFPQALSRIEATLLRQSNWSGGLVHRHADGRAIMAIGHWYLQRTADGRDALITEVHSDAVGVGWPRRVAGTRGRAMQSAMQKEEDTRTAPQGMEPHHARPDTLDLLEQFGTIVTVAREREINGQGEPVEFCWRILTGCVRTMKLMEDGRRQIGAFLWAGDIVGIDDLGTHIRRSLFGCER
jgi:CRP-like cAMP-binding protein